MKTEIKNVLEYMIFKSQNTLKIFYLISYFGSFNKN